MVRLNRLVGLRIGFTGTRFGMSERQRQNFIKLVEGWGPIEFHHGICQGSDAQAAAIVYKLPKRVIIGHPGPVGDGWRDNEAFLLCTALRPHLTHFARNRNIVDQTDLLVATPLTSKPQSGGGTWYTIEYAQKQHKEVILLEP